jgi:hypothetical protein
MRLFKEIIQNIGYLDSKLSYLFHKKIEINFQNKSLLFVAQTSHTLLDKYVGALKGGASNSEPLLQNLRLSVELVNLCVSYNFGSTYLDINLDPDRVDTQITNVRK